MAWLYKRPDSDKWWIGYRANGKQFLRSTKTSDETEARRQLATIQAMFTVHETKSLTLEVFEVLTGKAQPRKTLLAEVDDWLAECSTSTKPGTLDRYKSILGEFKAHVGASDNAPLLADVETEQIRTYLNRRLAKASASTANLERKILRMFFKRAIENGALKTNPAVPIKPFKSAAHKQPRRAFTLEDLETLFSKAPDDFWRYMILGGLYTGLRMGDLICLDWIAVDWKEGVLRVIPMKTSGTTGKTVQVPIHRTFRLMIERLWKAQGEPKRGPLWPERSALYLAKGANTFSSEFYEILTSCGLVDPREDKKGHKHGRDGKRKASKVSFHSLRHSFVTFLKVTGANSSVAKELAGHSSESMNQIYTHLPIETLAGAIAQLPEVTK